MHTHNLTPVAEEMPLPPDAQIKNPPIQSCQNCGTVISCGCQRVRATDGREVCDECVQSYEGSISGGGFVD